MATIGFCRVSFSLARLPARIGGNEGQPESAGCRRNLAEAARFESTDGRPWPVFKTSAIDCFAALAKGLPWRSTPSMLGGGRRGCAHATCSHSRCPTSTRNAVTAPPQTQPASNASRSGAVDRAQRRPVVEGDRRVLGAATRRGESGLLAWRAGLGNDPMAPFPVIAPAVPGRPSAPVSHQPGQPEHGLGYVGHEQQRGDQYQDEG
jgi:hypothetical protein